MPRSGPSGTYSLPPIYLAIPGTTIVVDQHNTPLQDIATTFNTVQPIDYGGTGADNAADALANLGGASGAANEYVTATGTATAIVADPTTAIPTLVTGRFVTWTAIADLTVGTGVTINVSGLGVRKLVKATDGGAERALAPLDNVTGGKYMAVYNSTLDGGTGAWVLVNPTQFYGDVRNRLVNPAMQISSVNGNTAGTANGYVPADNWAVFRVTSAGTITTQRVQSRTPKGSVDRIRTTITVADASLAAGEFLTQTQTILGNEVADFLYGSSTAKQAILRFGWKSPAGTYSIALHNAASDRSYVAQFTPAAADTDEYITLVIPGDTTGTWGTGTGAGITVDWVIAAGSTFQGAAGWQAGNILGLASNTNGMGTVASVFELYDVQFTLDQDNMGVPPAWELPSYRDESLYQSAVTLGTAVASTSGTEKDFTVPSWVRAIDVEFSGVGRSGSAVMKIQLGDAGGIETSGYTGSQSNNAGGAGAMSSGFSVCGGEGATARWSGAVALRLSNASNNTWNSQGILGRTDAAALNHSAGNKSLSAPITTVRITMDGVDTFAAGELNISYS